MSEEKPEKRHTYLSSDLFIPGVYRHYKGGFYRALMLIHAHWPSDETVLCTLYVSMTNGRVFARPWLKVGEDSWSDDVKVNDTWTPRFSYVGPSLEVKT